MHERGSIYFTLFICYFVCVCTRVLYVICICYPYHTHVYTIFFLKVIELSIIPIHF